MVLRLFITISIFFVSFISSSQRTVVENGPFDPYGGKRETTYDKNDKPFQLKQYDAQQNLRRDIVVKRDSGRRVTYIADTTFDAQSHLVKGYEQSIKYKDSLDYCGKIVYKKYDSTTGKFLLVEPLVSDYTKAMISKPPDSLRLDPFYKKYVDAGGIPIVSSHEVPDAALLTARDIVNSMLLKRPDVRELLIHRKSRVSVMAETEMQTDLPECRDWKKPTREDPRLTPGERENYDKPNGIGAMSDRQYWNQRARGMGGNEVSCAEENLLGYAGTRYYGENILVHEFSHNIMGALESVDTSLYTEIKKAYEAAKTKGLYKNQYAINTVDEYWAEGSQWWFWSNIEFYDGQTRIQTPDDLKTYDPVLYHIFERVYSIHHIPADIYYSLNLAPAR